MRRQKFIVSSFITTLSLGLILANSSAARAATLVADYQLQNTYNSSVGTIGPLDPVGPTADISFENDQNVDGNNQTVVQLNVNYGSAGDGGAGLQAQTSSSTATYLDPANYSVVMLANFDLAPDLVATKILDFKNLSSDDGLYINDATGLLYFNGVATGTGTTTAPTGTYTQIVLTRDSSDDLVSVYQDGALDFQFTDSSDLAVLGDSVTTSLNAYLTVFKDDGTGIGGQTVDETSVGDLARLRLYDGVLTPDQVAALDTSIPEPTTAASMLFSSLLILHRSRRRSILPPRPNSR